MARDNYCTNPSAAHWSVDGYMRQTRTRRPVFGELYTDSDPRRVKVSDLCRPGPRDARTLNLPKFPPGDPRNKEAA